MASVFGCRSHSKQQGASSSRGLPTSINPIQVRVSVFRRSWTEPAGPCRQPSRTPGPDTQTRGCTKPLSCLWSPAARLPLDSGDLPVPRDTKTRLATLSRHAADTEDQTAARCSSGVRVEKPNATHPRTHFPLLALFGYPSILWVPLAQPGAAVVLCAWQKLATLAVLEGFDHAGAAPAHVISVISSRHLSPPNY